MIELGVLKAAGLKVNSHTQINRHTAIIYTPDVQKCSDKGGTHTAHTQNLMSYRHPNKSLCQIK